jgi:hypothetical protein
VSGTRLAPLQCHVRAPSMQTVNLTQLPQGLHALTQLTCFQCPELHAAFVATRPDQTQDTVKLLGASCEGRSYVCPSVWADHSWTLVTDTAVPTCDERMKRLSGRVSLRHNLTVHC